MDISVGLVQTYLRVNGYFTVAEFPIVESGSGRTATSDLRTATDLDIIAFRFPRAGHLIPAAGSERARDRELASIDPVLCAPAEQGDMLIGEVKEGLAELNEAATDPAVLRAALARFGCCTREEAELVTRALIRRGRATLPNKHTVRLVAFGSTVPPGSGRSSTFVHCISLGHIIDFLREHIRAHWHVLKASGSKDPALGWLLIEEKAARGQPQTDPS